MKFKDAVLFVILSFVTLQVNAHENIDKKIEAENRVGCTSEGDLPKCLEASGYRCFKSEDFAPERMICRSSDEKGPSLLLNYNKKSNIWEIQIVH